MSTKAYLPVGEKTNYVTLSKGDVVELVTGEKIVFMEMKRTKWNGMFNGKRIIVPIWRNRSAQTPFIKAVVGKDTSVILPAANINKMRPGSLFFLEGHKETFMFIGTDVKRGGKKVVKGYDLASGKNYSIDAIMKMVPLDLNAIKKDLVK